MMLKPFVVGLIAIEMFAHTSFASERSPVSISDMEKESVSIVLGSVSEVVEKSTESHTGVQEITVTISKILRGQAKGSHFTLTLAYKGVKDFDPQLKVGEHAVFFLRSLEKGVGHLSTFGSIATFPRGENFTP